MAGLSVTPLEDVSRARYALFFRELDAWTEYWDVYHPETCGRYYFGDGATEAGLLTRFLPRETVPPVFAAWRRSALYEDCYDRFIAEVQVPGIAEAVVEVDELVARVFGNHFGNILNFEVWRDYLEAIHRFATDTLPPATDRDSLISADDPRKPTAARHMLEGDLMWFAWAMHLEAAQILKGVGSGGSRRALMMAGVATGCAANFAWRGHRRTRPEYQATEETAQTLREQGFRLAQSFEEAAAEVHALFRIRQWGSP